jgi:pimeloyl-ACP methyl ester carboxylesterase
MWARVERLAASPGGIRSLMRILGEIDVRCVLPSVAIPTLVLHAEGDFFPVEISRYLAEHIPRARWVELKGVDHYPWFGSVDPLVAEIEECMGWATSTRSTKGNKRRSPSTASCLQALYNRAPLFG